MLNYNGSSVEQYITHALISNELIVRNVITENTTGISEVLGITTLIMPRTECCHPDLCLESPAAAAAGSAFSHAIRHCKLKIPNMDKEEPKSLRFFTKIYISRHKWQHSGLLAAWRIRRRVLFCSLISWKQEEMAIKSKCRIWSKKIRYELIQVVSDTSANKSEVYISV